jgi:tripartite-type tricarboxylate transporter receptor subunit TctC
VARINRDVARIVQSPEMRQRFAVQGARPIGSTREEFAQFLGQEQTKWSRVIKEANIKPE